MRQMLTPDQLLERVVAVARLIALGTTPLGALLGGALAQNIGIRAALIFAAVWMVLWGIWLARSPIARLNRPLLS